MIPENLTTAVRTYRLKKTHERIVTPDAERESHKAAWNLENWLISDEGQEALNLLDASEQEVTLKRSVPGQGFREGRVCLTGRGFISEGLKGPEDGHGATLIKTFSAVSYAIGPKKTGSVLPGKSPESVLPYIQTQIAKIADGLMD